MRILRIAGPALAASLFLVAALGAAAQPQQSVDITSEPSHHLVFENEYLRAFDVIVAPKASTLVHRHEHDYLFVTLGDADLTNARVGEKPTGLQLKDGETRFTPGGFAHAASNNSDRPFHNITIDLLQTATNVKRCTESCEVPVPCAAAAKSACASVERRISSDQWVMSFVTMPPGSRLEKHTRAVPNLVVAVSNLDLTVVSGSSTREIKRAPGGLAWAHAGNHPLVNSAWLTGVTGTLINSSNDSAARFVTLEFTENKK
jgi:quercetin dioxygenase-like cupin family protein